MDLLIIWGILALIVGAVAARKNRSFVGWFFAVFLISPIIAGVIVLTLSPLPSFFEKKMKLLDDIDRDEFYNFDKQMKNMDDNDKDEFYNFDRKMRQLDEQQKGSDVADVIEKLYDLKQRGIITEAEFKAKKENLLGI